MKSTRLTEGERKRAQTSMKEEFLADIVINPKTGEVVKNRFGNLRGRWTRATMLKEYARLLKANRTLTERLEEERRSGEREHQLRVELDAWMQTQLAKKDDDLAIVRKTCQNAEGALLKAAEKIQTLTHVIVNMATERFPPKVTP